MVFGAEQEPPCLNGFLEGCNNTWTSWSVGTPFPGLDEIVPNFDLTPYMGDGEVKFTKSPFTVTYTLKKTRTGATASRSQPTT